MFTSAEIFASIFANIFVGYDDELCNLTVHALQIFSISFLFIGFNIFGSAFFTALNNGILSAVIFGVDGIWFSVIAAEIGAFILTGIILFANRKKYNYA